MQCELYDRERLDRADPAYLAPFHLQTIKDEAGSSSRRTRRVQDAGCFPRNDPNSPALFGNCLCLFPCQCGGCSLLLSSSSGTDGTAKSSPVPCLLHPVGPLQDRVRASFLKLPRGRNITVQQAPRDNPLRSSHSNKSQPKDPFLFPPEELYVGDRIRQLEQCGDNPLMFLVRTSLHITVFSLTFVKPRNKVTVHDEECWSNANLKPVHRIDYRTLLRAKLSYRPSHVTSHPRFGVHGFTPSIFAAVYECSNGSRNHIYHFVGSADSLNVQRRAITNLQDISEIQFSSSHPMVLTSNYQRKYPRIGHGHSLFSVDLRVKDDTAATFQWSPSAEEFGPEGVHSISGVYVDWDRTHSLLASSVSAGKTWELDTRMPWKAVQTWSLPHSGDHGPPNLPATGLIGAGMLFSKLQIFERDPDGSVLSPIFGVRKDPWCQSLHLYYRREQKALFQTEPVECLASRNLSALGATTLTTSSAYTIPDVAANVFTCGLAAFRVDLQNYLPEDIATQCGVKDSATTSVACALSLTNRGDIYTHNLFGFNALSDDRHVDIGSILSQSQGENGGAKSWNVLTVQLSDLSPIPSSAIKHVANESVARIDGWYPLDIVSKYMKKSRKRKNDDDQASAFCLDDAAPALVQPSECSKGNVLADNKLAVPIMLPPHRTQSPASNAELFASSEHVANQSNVPSVARSDLPASVIKNAWQANDSSSDDNSYA
jgi:hypothetical protein